MPHQLGSAFQALDSLIFSKFKCGLAPLTNFRQHFGVVERQADWALWADWAAVSLLAAASPIMDDVHSWAAQFWRLY